MFHKVKGSTSNDSLAEINLFGSLNTSNLINAYFTRTHEQARFKLNVRPQSTKRIENSKPIEFYTRPERPLELS